MSRHIWGAYFNFRGITRKAVVQLPQKFWGMNFRGLTRASDFPLPPQKIPELEDCQKNFQGIYFDQIARFSGDQLPKHV